MPTPIRILLQTTILPDPDDWNIGRFGMLRDYLAGLGDGDGAPLFAVTARDRAVAGAPDPVLSTIDRSDFDELWLFAVDTGDGLHPDDSAAIARFRRGGRGLLVTRDHMDLGSSVCALGGVGEAHFFHSRNCDPDPDRHRVDDRETSAILWPNYHSGANGDFQRIVPVGEPHPVLRDPEAPGGLIRYLPAHPHEGAVGAPGGDPDARVIAAGTSKVTGRSFNIAVAFEPSRKGGPAIAQSTFHHFADYNWDPSAGCPSFVREAPGSGIARSPEAWRSIRRYVRNVALWLAGRPTAEPRAVADLSDGSVRLGPERKSTACRPLPKLPDAVSPAAFNRMEEMQLDTMTRPERMPEPMAAEELVPSRYALKIGDIDVLVISDGVLPLPTETMSTNVEPTLRAAWFKDTFLGPDKFDWALNVLVVRSGDRVILVDAGLGGQFPGFPRAGQFPKRLAAAGIALESVTDVVLTHMHMDHVGGLLVDEVRSRLDPGVRVHVAAAEVAFWKAPDFTRTVMPAPVPDALRAAAARFVELFGDGLQTFDERHEVAPGVIVERSGGHTPGHSIVRISSAGERLMFAGDALFPVAFDHPDWQNGFEHDPEEAVRVRLRLMHEAARTGELLIASHLPFPSIGRIALSGDHFRWIAAIWDY